ncbi:MAG: ATP-binding protein [Roseiflexaceae bacterium]|nr:ATP-binding protein [Roseiflexaceae bacterium]
MPRSLTFKLTLAFLLTGLACVALVGVFARYQTSLEFDRFLREREQADFVTIVTNYYQQHGTWDGLAEVIRGAPPRPANSAPGQPGQPPPQQNPFVVVDQQNNVVVGSGQYRRGTNVPANIIALGQAITVDGTRVGTVISQQSSPALDQRERDYLERSNRTLIYASFGGALLALIIGVVLAQILTRPIRALTIAIGAMRRGEIQQTVHVSTKDEIGDLVLAFNQMSADLARANTARRQMTADIAHELNSPLSVLSGYLESMRDGILPPTPERFQTMYDEARQLQRLIGDLRLLSLADAGELSLKRQQIKPRQLLDMVAASFEPRANQQGIQLRVNAADDLPDLDIDRERMLQVLGNLVGNALRYTTTGGAITLSVVNDHECVRLDVADTGIGIAPDVLPRIFERLYRADPSRQEHDGGSGLGLAIAKAIVEMHNGTISAQSVPDRGTTMTIMLPSSFH